MTPKKNCFFSMSKTYCVNSRLIRPAPAELEYKNMRFLITEQPQDATIRGYISILKEHKVSHLVCATDPTYKTDDLSEAGVSVTEMSFPGQLLKLKTFVNLLVLGYLLALQFQFSFLAHLLEFKVSSKTHQQMVLTKFFSSNYKILS